MTAVAFLFDPIFLLHETPPGHPESPSRLARVHEHLVKRGMLDFLLQPEVRPATREDLLPVHAGAYLDGLAAPGERYLDPDTYLGARSWEAALAAAGAVVTALDLCRSGQASRAFCAVRPPGHHALRDRAMGFCLINNVAVGARHAQKIGYERVMVADFDVHHGNGTQEAFYEDDTVYYFSTHEYPHYPGTGAAGERGAGRGSGFTRNIPLRSGAGDVELRDAWRERFPADVASFRPNLCLVSAGYDLHAGDPLAGLAVSDEGVRDIVRAILEACSGLPVVFSLEGGYDPPALARCVRITVEELLR
jgi:acetoin utilization deacetylase AcuC-like enzyme